MKMGHRGSVFRILLRSRTLGRYLVAPQVCGFHFKSVKRSGGTILKVKAPRYFFPVSENCICFSSSPFQRCVTTSTARLTSEDNEDDSESDNDSDSDIEDVLSSDVHVLQTTSEKNHRTYTREILYPESDDPLIHRLKECASVQGVFDLVTQHMNEFNSHHSSQAVLVLWDLQRSYHVLNVHEPFDPSTNSVVDPQALLEEYAEKVKSHESFQTLLELVESSVPEMCVNAAACTLLHLNKMNVPLTHPLMKKLIAHCEKYFNELGNQTPLSALSRFCVAVKHSKSDYQGLSSYLPIIKNKLAFADQPPGVEEIRLLTICLSRMNFTDKDTLELYKKKLTEMIENGCFTAKNSNTILKIAMYLNHPLWAWKNADLMKKFLSILKGNMSSLKNEELVQAYKVFQNQLEPANILADLQEEASKRLLRSEDLPSTFYTSACLLCCVASFTSPIDKQEFEELTFRHVEKISSVPSLPVLFRIIRNLKTSNLDLCNAFWSRVVDLLTLYPEEREDYKLLRFCHRYIYFNNNLGGTFRHSLFEVKMVEWLMDHLESGSLSATSHKLSHAASFLIAYGVQKGSQYKNILDRIVKKLTEMSQDLTPNDCLSISRGYQVAMHLHPKVVFRDEILHIFVLLDSLLNACARSHLETPSDNLVSVNVLMRTILNRKGPLNTDVFHKCIERYEHLNGDINSRILRDAALNFLLSGCLIPKTMDVLAEYVTAKKDHLLGETVEKLLFVSYILGYTPNNSQDFLEAAAEVIVRDKARMDGLSLMQGSLALCFYRSLPEDLVHFIFTVQFLDRLDKEISHCYSKASYPARLRNILMQLNRAVCLDYPEVDVPWFHEKFVEQIKALEPAQTSPFFREVKRVLTDVLGASYLLQSDVWSSYGYKIDFEIVMDERGVPLSPKRRTDRNVTKMAILLLEEDSFTHHVRTLKGPHQLKKRHLEILGYKVLEITSTMWNAMYMSEPGAKYDLLKEKIWPHQAL